jgi:outer membrane protein OmpA-like peptidoglycan-associated protein
MLTPRLARLITFGSAAIACLSAVNPPRATAEEGPSVQTAAYVRVVAESSHITRRPGAGDVMADVAQGTVLEALNKDGAYYWVLLERDDYGTRRAGFIARRDIEPLSAEESATKNRGARNERSTAPAPMARATQVANTDAPALTTSFAPPALVAEVTKTPVAAAPRPSAPVRELCEVLVHFQFGKTDLRDDGRQQIERALAEIQGSAQGISYEIEGHADAVGTEPFNQQLGQARAEAIKEYLAAKHGVPLERMKVVSYGESRPMAPNSTKEGRALNRRVVLRILG